MRIGLDARAYDWTGIGRYARNLLAHLPRPSGVQYVVFVPPRGTRGVADLPSTQVVPVRDSYYSLYEQTGFLRTLLATPLDLMHFPHFNAPILYRRPAVVTLHDLTRFVFAGQRRQSRIHQWAYERVFHATVRHATHIIAVSAFTKDELIRRFPGTAPKVSVIAEGVEERFVAGNRESAATSRDQEVLHRMKVSTPFLLYVGLWMRHKNLPGLIEAFRILRERRYRGSLVLTGEGRPWDEDVRALAQRAGVADHIRLPGLVDDDQLALLYRAADVLVVPSFVEGFGLPALEAMASGTPVVATRAGSLPEVLSDAALYADPNRPGDIAASIARILGNPALRDDVRARGRARAAQFSWERCARETFEVYRDVLRS